MVRCQCWIWGCGAVWHYWGESLGVRLYVFDVMNKEYHDISPGLCCIVLLYLYSLLIYYVNNATSDWFRIRSSSVENSHRVRIMLAAIYNDTIMSAKMSCQLVMCYLVVLRFKCRKSTYFRCRVLTFKVGRLLSWVHANSLQTMSWIKENFYGNWWNDVVIHLRIPMTFVFFQIS